MLEPTLSDREAEAQSKGTRPTPVLIDSLCRSLVRSEDEPPQPVTPPRAARSSRRGTPHARWLLTSAGCGRCGGTLQEAELELP